MTDRMQYNGDCATCGKKCYESRKAARKAARVLYPGQRLCEYACGDWWHLTHRISSSRNLSLKKRQGRA